MELEDCHRLDLALDLAQNLHCYEFLPRGVHKGRCLRDLRCLDVLRGRRMVAVGDYTNDLELLAEADISVAVANALPEVRAAADYHTVCQDESAIAHLIYEILPSI